jgi:hypothetical protein
MLAPEVVQPWISPKRRVRALRVLVGATVVAGLVARMASPFHGESKARIAKGTVVRYAFEAYPSWVATHHMVCPRSLVDLNEFMTAKDTRDPWGTPYYFACGPLTVPRTANGIWVVSAGADRRFGTDDDVRSDR